MTKPYLPSSLAWYTLLAQEYILNEVHSRAVGTSVIPFTWYYFSGTQHIQTEGRKDVSSDEDWCVFAFPDSVAKMVSCVKIKHRNATKSKPKPSQVLHRFLSRIVFTIETLQPYTMMVMQHPHSGPQCKTT